MKLRPYQRECVEAAYAYLRARDGNPVAVLPTAAGKSIIIAQICTDTVDLWKGRVCVLSHVRELLEQTGDKLQRLAPSLTIGFYSAGLGRRDTMWSVLLCQIQSVYRRACELGPFDLVIIDETHLVGENDEGMFRQFLADAAIVNPHMRVIGLTATPFRMKSGPICGPDRIFSDICYEVGVRELIVQGYLCPLRSKAGRSRVDTSGLHVRGGEFIASEVEQLMDDAALVETACREIVEQTRDRQAVLIFAAGVAHAQHVRATLEQLGQECGFVCGDTTPLERAATLDRFRTGDLKFLVNVNVLTTGFDAPNIDCVCLLRPTNSPGLYYQAVGRGFRLHPGKTDCLVLDYGGNILRHGPVDDLRIKDRTPGDGPAPAKECPECNALVHAAYATCPECGYEFPPPERQKHEQSATTAGVLTGETTDSDYDVRETFYCVHAKRDAGPDHPRTMRVDYRIGWQQYQSEWVCVEHTGYARAKAEAWWRQRCDLPLPTNAEEAVALAHEGSLAEPTRITVREIAGEKYPRIVAYELGPKPDHREPGWDDEDDVPVDSAYDVVDDEIPF